MTVGRPQRSQHGDYGMARRYGCTCEDCKTAHRKYVKGLNVDHARGIRRRQPAGPIRDHLWELMIAGVQQSQIWNAAGIAHTQVTRVMKPTTEYVLRPTAEKLLALTVADCMKFPHRVSALGTRRRIEALHFLGHSKKAIADMLGESEFAIFQRFARETVMDHEHRKVDELYQRLHLTEPVETRMYWQSRWSGYVPPMAWDEGDIDDPEAKPAEVVCAVCRNIAYKRTLCQHHYAEARKLDGVETLYAYRRSVTKLRDRQQQTTGVVLKQLHELRQLGYTSPAQAARHLGLTEGYIEKLWRKAA